MVSDFQITFQHHESDSVSDILDSVVGPLYEATHQDVIADPFYSSGRFLERVRGYAKSPGFEIVVGVSKVGPVGQTFGYPLPQHARWWNGLTTPVDPSLIAENGSRTFALCELMVHPDWQRRGLAHLLHDELLNNRPEQRAALLVRGDNHAANQAYAKWGWRTIGKLQPYADSPHYDALILDLK